MFMRDQLGSLSALSLAANPAALPVLAVTAGIGVTVAASIFIYHEIKAYEEKKHKEEIDEIIRLHKKYLEKILVPEYQEIQGFPAIFKIPDNKDYSKTQAMHFNDEEIDDIGKTLPHGTDTALFYYRELVLSAVLKLKEYYKMRPSKTDTTASVLTYLLYMLQTKCLSFEGYAYDIAYLSAITNFITAFASIKDSDKTQHFSRLQPVYSYLLSAKQILEKHKQTLSLNEIIHELRDDCEASANQLIRIMVKFVTKANHWDLTQTAAMDEIAVGILRRKYVHTEVKSIVLRHDDALELPTSIFKDWTQALAKYFLLTLDSSQCLTNKQILAPDQLFLIPNISQLPSYRQDKKKKNHANSGLINQIETEIENIRKIFKECPSFVTTKLKPGINNETPVFIPVTKTLELLDRTRIMAGFASLTHQVISLQYFSTQLLNSIEQLGVIYVKNPKHFCNIFRVLESLCDQVKDKINFNKKMFMAIEQENKNAMKLEKQQLFPGQVLDTLTTTYAMVNKLGADVKEYRSKVAKNINHSEPTIDSVKHEMFEAAILMATIYKLNLCPADKSQPSPPRASFLEEPPVVQEPICHSLSDDEPDDVIKEDPLPIVSPSSRTGHLSQESSPSPLVTEPPTPPDSVAPVKDPVLSSVLPVETTLTEQASVLVHINTVLVDTYRRILEIETTEGQTSHSFRTEISAYMKLYNDLQRMQKKSHDMSHEENRSDERNQKAEQVAALTLQLCQNTLNFLTLEREERISRTTSFSIQFRDELTNTENSFIDLHHRHSSHLLYSYTHASFFATDTRKYLNGLRADTENIVQVLVRP